MILELATSFQNIKAADKMLSNPSKKEYHKFAAELKIRCLKVGLKLDAKEKRSYYREEIEKLKNKYK